MHSNSKRGRMGVFTRLGWFIVRARFAFFLIGLSIAVLGGFATSTMSLRDDPNAWPPASHPNVQINHQLQERFGGGNLVSITLTVREGDIFNKATLTKIKKITERIALVDGVIPYTIQSLSSISTKAMTFFPATEGEEGETLDIHPLMNPKRAPETATEVAQIRKDAYNKNTLAEGFLFSSDGKSTRIVADFRTIPFANLPFTEPVAIYNAVQAIIGEEADANHVIRATGTPVIIGWVNSEGLQYVRLAFVFFLLAVAASLWISFRNVVGVVFPIAVGLFGTLMGFGLYRVFSGDVLGSASVLIAPFIIIAAGSFHAVQFLKRFFEEELPRHDDSREAAVTTFSARFIPMFVSLLTDTAAFVVLSYIPFENVRLLGIVTVFGLLSVTLGEFFLLLPALSLLPDGFLRRARRTHCGANNREEGNLETRIRAIITPLVHNRRTQKAVVVVFVALLVVSAWSLRGVVAGQDNTYAVHNFLTKSWEGNSIYEMEVDIRERFGGVYPMTLLIEARDKDAYKPLQEPQALQKIDAFASFLDADPAVHGVTGLPVFLKAMNRFMTGDKDENFVVPVDASAIGSYFYFYTSGQPGGFDAYVDPDFTASVLTAVVEDTRHETVDRLLHKAHTYAEAEFNDDVVYARVAGGAIGIAGAFNENIGKWLVIGSALSALVTWLVAAVLLRSIVLPLILLLPLFVATIIWLALIRALGVELNSNTVTSLAIASGIGIDAGVYCLYRLREEMRDGTTFDEALVAAFVHIFRPLAASNAALILGCWALVPIPLYIGYVGFGMGAILLLTTISSFVLHPVVWSTLRPACIRGAENGRVARAATSTI